MSNHIDSARLTDLLAASSPGPWRATASRSGWLIHDRIGDSLAGLALRTGDHPAAEQTANAQLIAMLPDLVPQTLTALITRQRDFSARAFGPGDRTAGVLAHIRKELDEVAAAPTDLSEWADVVLLALDGAWRASGADPGQVAAAILGKLGINEQRAWPDWRTAAADQPIEHIKPAPEDADDNRTLACARAMRGLLP